MRSMKISEDRRGVVQRFCETPHPVSRQSIFPTRRDLACFAAVLGFEHGRRIPLVGPTEELVDGRIFSRDDLAIDLLLLLGLADSHDVAVLRDGGEERLVTIFEEYLNGGLDVLSTWLGTASAETSADRALLAALSDAGYLQGGDIGPDSVAAKVAF